MAARRPISWAPLMVAMVAGAALAGVIVWRFNLQAIEHDIDAKQAALKKLSLSGGIPPNQEVMDYLTTRQSALERRYQQALMAFVSAPVAEAATADPQLYFQEQFHEVQRALERLAAARGVPVPEQLGFPKELPPSDTVARLLIQLSLIQEASALIFEHGVNVLSSFKVEDPEPVPMEEEETAFLLRLPVRVHLTASLTQLMKVLGALQQARPLIDVSVLRIGSGETPERLDVELLLCRYLALATTEPTATDDGEDRPSKKKPSRTRRATTQPAE